MPLIMCTKFQTNQTLLTLFSGVWDKNPPRSWESRKMPYAIGLRFLIRDRSLFIGITGSGKFNWNFSRFSWPVHGTFKKFKTRTSYHNFFQDPSGTNTDFFPYYDIQ